MFIFNISEKIVFYVQILMKVIAKMKTFREREREKPWEILIYLIIESLLKV
jgi:hypothetical protein